MFHSHWNCRSRAWEIARVEELTERVEEERKLRPQPWFRAKLENIKKTSQLEKEKGQSKQKKITGNAVY